MGKRSSAGVEVRVHPAFVRQDHPLASAGGNYNAVFVTGDSVGDVMLYGQGAGALPTGSAIVSDIIFASTHGEMRYSTFKNGAAPEKDMKFLSDFRSAYYLRLTVDDEPGVLAKLSSILAKYNISIVELIQRTAKGEAGKATLVLVTHETHELAVKNAVAKLNATGLARVESVLRVAL